jgi:hypothetical protein
MCIKGCWNNHNNDYTTRMAKYKFRGKKDGLEKEVDLFMKETSFLDKVCFEYLWKRAVSCNEFVCFCWMI